MCEKNIQKSIQAALSSENQADIFETHGGSLIVARANCRGQNLTPTAVSEMIYSRESGIVIFPAGVEPRRQKAANRTMYIAVTTTRITAYSK